jgi:hypothetical protein
MTVERPTTVIIARTRGEAETYARTLPQRHVAVMDHQHAANTRALRGWGRGTTVHLLPLRIDDARMPFDPDRLDEAIADVEARGAVVVRPLDRSPRRRPMAARGATNRNRQPSKEERTR